MNKNQYKLKISIILVFKKLRPQLVVKQEGGSADLGTAMAPAFCLGMYSLSEKVLLENNNNKLHFRFFCSICAY